MRLHDTFLLACCRCCEPHATLQCVIFRCYILISDRLSSTCNFHLPIGISYRFPFHDGTPFFLSSFANIITFSLALFFFNRIMYTYFPNSRKLLPRTVYVSLHYKMYFLLWKCCADCKFGYYASTSQNGSELRVPGSQSSYYTKRTAFPRGNLRLSRNVNAFNGIPTSPSRDSFPRAQIALRPARPFYIPEASPQMETAS